MGTQNHSIYMLQQQDFGFYFSLIYLTPFLLVQPEIECTVNVGMKNSQTKFLYFAKLVDNMTRLQLPADLAILVKQLSRNLSPFRRACGFQNLVWTPL